MAVVKAELLKVKAAMALALVVLADIPDKAETGNLNPMVALDRVAEPVLGQGVFLEVILRCLAAAALVLMDKVQTGLALLLVSLEPLKAVVVAPVGATAGLRVTQPEETMVAVLVQIRTRIAPQK
jgi:hypothetical protein